jgi:hypothetical protein
VGTREAVNLEVKSVVVNSVVKVVQVVGSVEACEDHNPCNLFLQGKS